MSFDVDYNVMKANYRMVGRSLNTWMLSLYSKLKGDLKEGYYY